MNTMVQNAKLMDENILVQNPKKTLNGWDVQKNCVCLIPSLLLHDFFLHSFADLLLGHGILHGFANDIGFGGTERIRSMGRVKILSVALFHCNVVALGQGQKEKFVPVAGHVIHDGKIPKPCEDLLTNSGVHFVDSSTQSWTKTSLQQGDSLKVTKWKQDLGIEECSCWSEIFLLKNPER